MAEGKKEYKGKINTLPFFPPSPTYKLLLFSSFFFTEYYLTFSLSLSLSLSLALQTLKLAHSHRFVSLSLADFSWFRSPILHMFLFFYFKCFLFPPNILGFPILFSPKTFRVFYFLFFFRLRIPRTKMIVACFRLNI